MKRYIKPQAAIVKVNLYNSCMEEDNKTYSPGGAPEFSGGGGGKQDPFGTDNDDSQETSANIWK